MQIQPLLASRLIAQFLSVQDGIPARKLLADPILAMHAEAADVQTNDSTAKVVLADLEHIDDTEACACKTAAQLHFFYIATLLLLLRRHGIACVIQDMPPETFDWEHYRKARKFSFSVAEFGGTGLHISPHTIRAFSMNVRALRPKDTVFRFLIDSQLGLDCEVRWVSAIRRGHVYTQLKRFWGIPHTMMFENINEDLLRMRIQ
jgi:hypothetical protein